MDLSVLPVHAVLGARVYEDWIVEETIWSNGISIIRHIEGEQMNPVLILTHNGIAFTERCVDSLRRQDIPVIIYTVDNGSTDGTREWMEKSNDIKWCRLDHNAGVSFGWNDGLGRIFGTDRLFNYEGRIDIFEHCLVIGNDTVLPNFFYRELLSYNLPFVTGVAVDSMKQAEILPEHSEPVPNPDFSAFLIRRECWEKVGPFDERMVSWCSDCDYHVRAHRMGIPLMKVNVPFYHLRSRTIELAPPREKRMLEMQADADRLTFFEKWKARVGSPQYADLFSPDAFGIDLD
jgi:GT2 family glycosyltransferase